MGQPFSWVVLLFIITERGCPILAFFARVGGDAADAFRCEPARREGARPMGVPPFKKRRVGHPASIKFMANFLEVGFYVFEPRSCIVNIFFEYQDGIIAGIAAQNV